MLIKKGFILIPQTLHDYKAEKILVLMIPNIMHVLFAERTKQRHEYQEVKFSSRAEKSRPW